MKEQYEVDGIIESVFEDLGPSTQVRIKLDNGGTYTIDALALPFHSETLRNSIGKRLWFKAIATIND